MTSYSSMKKGLRVAAVIINEKSNNNNNNNNDSKNNSPALKFKSLS